jgi:hypothetical protein
MSSLYHLSEQNVLRSKSRKRSSSSASLSTYCYLHGISLGSRLYFSQLFLNNFHFRMLIPEHID